MSINSQTYQFQAEINQLMSLIINAFYSNKDIFIRELVSNASDALDKIRHQSLTDHKCLESREELGIWISVDKENNQLIIEDSGIGMTKSDLINNLGTIARSGTRQFMENLQTTGDMNLIGQFGVGFYAAYLVADKVQVISKHNDDNCYIWESSAGGTFVISDHQDDNQKRGTKIILHMKEGLDEYLKESKIKDLVKNHSQYVNYPIYLLVNKERDVHKLNEMSSDAKVDEVKSDEVKSDEVKSDEVKSDNVNPDEVKSDDVNPDEVKAETVKEKYQEFEHLNTQRPIWIRDPQDVTEDEYKKFYKSISNDWEEAQGHKHFKVEGQLEFTGLIYCPSKAPSDMFQAEKKRNNLRLHVKRVFITDNCDELVPEWLTFVKGVIDSEDLPLNISREFLQQNKILNTMKKHIVKKCLDLFEQIVNDEDKEKANKFYEEFGKNIKLGIHEDNINRSRLVDLLRYSTTNDQDKLHSLSDYLSRMKDNQSKIYYITGDSVTTLSKTPFIEQCLNKGIEVIYMTDPLDEYVMQQVKDFKDKKFVCLSKEGFELDATEEEHHKRKQELEQEKKDNEKLCEFFKSTLKDKIEKVDISSRLVDSPMCLVTNQFGWSANMERIMKSQALKNNMPSYMLSKKTLEINPKHSIIRHLRQKIESGDDSEKQSMSNIIQLLFSNTLLQSGFSLDEPDRFNQQILNLVTLGLDIDNDEQVPDSLVGSDNSMESGVVESGNSMESGVVESGISMESVD